MKHAYRILILFLLSVAVLFLLQKKVSADTTPTPTNMPTTGSYAEMCLPAKIATAAETANLSKHDHVALLTKSGLPTDKQIIIVACIVANDTSYCKSDSPANDDALKKLNFPVNPYKGHQFIVYGQNPFTTTNGNLSVYVYSHTPTGRTHSFYAVFPGTVQQIGGQANTLQYGTFQLGQDPGKCVSITWDPEGRVFDAQSLEPLPTSNVKLLNNAKALVPALPLLDPQDPKNAPLCGSAPLRCGEENPQITKEDGQFNFDIVDGSYYLDIVKSGYTFPVDLSQVQPNYTKAYSCNESTNTYPIYTKSPTGDTYPIKVAGAPVHCDVPAISKAGTPYHANPIIMKDDDGNLSYSHSLVPGTTSVKYEGSFSHPLTNYTLTDSATGKIVAQGSANQNGDFEFVVDNAVLQNGNILPTILTWTKVDLTVNQPTAKNFDIFTFLLKLIKPKQVSAQTTVGSNSISFEPIFTYIEGYAYDKAGKVLPNAKVVVKLNTTNDPFFETNSDANGLFSIPSQSLPTFSYYLEITPANSTVSIKYTTSEFAKANQNYLTTNKINLLTATKNGQSLLPTSPVIPTSTQVNPTVTVEQNNSQYTIVLTVIMLVVLFVVAGGILMYIKKKDSQPNNFPQQ